MTAKKKTTKRRSAKITVRVSETEMRNLRRSAKTSNSDVSNYVRARLFEAQS